MLGPFIFKPVAFELYVIVLIVFPLTELNLLLNFFFRLTESLFSAQFKLTDDGFKTVFVCVVIVCPPYENDLIYICSEALFISFPDFNALSF